MDHGERWNLAFPPASSGHGRFLLLEAWGELLVFVWLQLGLEAEAEPRGTKVRRSRGDRGQLTGSLGQ